METVCAELGIDLTTAFTMLAKTMVREHRVPFEVSIDPFYSESNLKHLREGIAELNAGHGVPHNLVKS